MNRNMLILCIYTYNIIHDANIMHHLYFTNISWWKIAFLKIIDSANRQSDLLYVFNTERRKTQSDFEKKSRAWKSHPSLYSSMNHNGELVLLILQLNIHREVYIHKKQTNKKTHPNTKSPQLVSGVSNMTWKNTNSWCEINQDKHFMGILV